MRKAIKLLMLLVVLALVAAACGDSESDETTAAPAETTAAPAETTAAPAETTAAPAETTAAPAGLSCDAPITVGVITDLTGALAIYGAHINRGVPIGFAYATGGEVQTGLKQTYMLEDCQIDVVFKDDQEQRRAECYRRP